MIQLKDIIDAYIHCRKNKRNKYSALNFETNYPEECLKLTEELNSRTYKIGASTTFIVDKPKQREIFAANFRDRIVHHWLIIRLEPLFENYFIQDTYNCRKGKGTYYGVQRLYSKIKQISDNYTKDCYIAKFDMQGFFMSIDKTLLWNMLEKFILEKYQNESDKEDVLYFAKMITLHSPENNCIRKGNISRWKNLPKNKSLFTCGKNYGLPIGNITSQMFANFYLTEFDKLMVSIFGNGYGRYVDDFFIISKNKQKILSHINLIKKELLKYHITLHPKKIYIQHFSKGISFTGSTTKYNRIYTNNRTIYNFKKTIEEINNNYNLEIDKVLCRINSYLGFLCHTNSYNIRKKLINKLDKYWKYQFNVRTDFTAIIKKYG